MADEFVQVRVGGPIYCTCGNAMVQMKRTDLAVKLGKVVTTLECYNPTCDRNGRVFLAPMVQLEEVAVTEASHG